MNRKRPRRSMGKWTPSPDELIRQFTHVVSDMPEVEVRKMFGFPVAFVNGQMFGGLFQDAVFVRLSPEDRPRLDGAVPFEPISGRPMREYVVVPASVANADGELRAWLDRGRRFARSLPPKHKSRTRAAAPRRGVASH